MDISNFLIWLAGGGSLIAASWILGQFVWYSTLVEKAKQWIFFGLAVVFGSGSYAITQYVPKIVLDAIAPYFLIVAFVFTAVFLKQTYTTVTTKLSEITKLLKLLNK